MRPILVLVVILVLAYAAVPNYEKYYDNKFEAIRKQNEELLHSLPKALQEDATLRVPELIRKYGFPCEVHTVTSKDGYVLEIHRIPYGSKGPSANRPAVYLQHGLLSSSADWLLAGTKNSLAYILADNGYDVWMLNARGTRYSRKHIKLDPDKDAKTFWDFSWHEIAIDDVATTIDYIIQETKQEEIFYIGHSQGTTVSYVLLSEKPEYNKKLKVVFSLAPAAYMGHMTSPLLRIITWFDGPIEFLLNLIGMYELKPTNDFLAQVAETYCSDGSIFQILCTNTFFILCGFNPDQMNATLIPVIMGHTPAGAATKQVLHYSQEIKSKKFCQYDYGRRENMNRYGSKVPPNYNLKKITAPVYMFYSYNDWMSHPRDVNKLYKELGNPKGKFVSIDDRFNHIDYLYAMNAPKILYNRLLGLMKKY